MVFSNLLLAKYTLSISPCSNLSRRTFIEPIKSSKAGISPSFSEAATTSPPKELKKTLALVPTGQNICFTPASVCSFKKGNKVLKRLIFKPPHKPLSDPTTITPTPLTSLSDMYKGLYSGLELAK